MKNKKTLGEQVDSARWAIVIVADKPDTVVIEAADAGADAEAIRALRHAAISGIRGGFAEQISLTVTAVAGKPIYVQTTLARLGDFMLSILKEPQSRQSSTEAPASSDPAPVV
jgi:hypothetical protein